MAPLSRICCPVVGAFALLLTACGADSTDDTTTDMAIAGDATLSAASWAAVPVNPCRDPM